MRKLFSVFKFVSSNSLILLVSILGYLTYQRNLVGQDINRTDETIQTYERFIEAVVEDVAKRCFSKSDKVDWRSESKDKSQAIDCLDNALKNPPGPFVLQRGRIKEAKVVCSTSEPTYGDCWIGSINVGRILGIPDPGKSSSSTDIKVGRIFEDIINFSKSVLKSNKDRYNLHPFDRMIHVFNRNGEELLNELGEKHPGFNFSLTQGQSAILAEEKGSGNGIHFYPMELFFSAGEKSTLIKELTAGSIFFPLTTGRIVRVNLENIVPSLIAEINNLSPVDEQGLIENLDRMKLIEQSIQKVVRRIVHSSQNTGSNLDLISGSFENGDSNTEENNNSDFEIAAGGGMSYRLPFNHIVVKVLGLEYIVSSRITDVDSVFKWITKLLKKRGFDVYEFNNSIPQALPSMFQRGLTSEAQFYNPTNALAYFLRLIKLSSIFIYDGHGFLFDRNNYYGQPGLLLYGFYAPDNFGESDTKFAACMLANYVYFHLTNRKRFSNFANLIDECSRYGDTYYSLDNDKIAAYPIAEYLAYKIREDEMQRTGRTILGITVSLDFLQGSKKSLMFGSSCFSRVPLSEVESNIFIQGHVNYTNYSGLKALDIIFPSCNTPAGQNQCFVGSSKAFDHALARDLFGLTYLIGETPSFLTNNVNFNSLPLWGTDANYTHGLSSAVKPCFQSDPNAIAGMIANLGFYSSNLRKTFYRSVAHRNFWTSDCPYNEEFLQSYAVAGMPHRGYLQGLNPILSPTQNFFRLPHFNYKLYSAEDSVRSRLSFYGVAWFNRIRVGGDPISTVMPAGPVQDGQNGRWMLRLQDLRNPYTRLFRHPNLLDRGLKNVSMTLGVRVDDVRVSSSQNTVEIDFDIPFWNVGESEIKILLSRAMQATRRTPNRQHFDFSPYILARPPTMSEDGKRLIFNFEPSAVQILDKNTWLLEFSEFKKKYPKVNFRSANSQFDWQYFMEIHIFGGKLAGNASQMRASTSFNYQNRRLFWAWPLRDPRGIWQVVQNPQTSLEYKRDLMLRSAPYMIGLGQLYEVENNALVYNPDFLSIPDRNRQDMFVLRVPLEPKLVTCVIRVQTGCKRIKRRSGGRAFLSGDGSDGSFDDPDECIVRVCGDLPSESSCLSDYPSHHNVDVLEQCILGPATCCPNVDSGACGDTLTCETRQGFESEEELDEFKQNCTANGGTFFSHCEVGGWETNCCNETEGICEDSVIEGCCPDENSDGGDFEFMSFFLSLGDSGEGGTCSGQTQSSQYIEVNEYGQMEVKKCPGVEIPCDTTPTPTPTATVSPTITRTTTATITPSPTGTISPSPTRGGNGWRGQRGFRDNFGFKGSVEVRGLPFGSNGINSNGHIYPFGWKGFNPNGNTGGRGQNISRGTPTPVQTAVLTPRYF